MAAARSRRGCERPRSHDPAPTGSQRALARLRDAVDQAAARRRAYVRLATVSPSLGAPEGAVVAAFERMDLIGSDAMSEIVGGAIEPDRALSDHAFAHRLAERAGTAILIGSGPLVVAPDLSSGFPSDPSTRAGRALALQILGVLLARGDGLRGGSGHRRRPAAVGRSRSPRPAPGPSPRSRSVGPSSTGTRSGSSRPSSRSERSVSWPFVQAAAAVHAGDVALVLRIRGRPAGRRRRLGEDGPRGRRRGGRRRRGIRSPAP